MDRMKLVYVAGPYRADTDDEVYENIQRARQRAKRHWQKGHAVFCPHLNTAFFSGVVPEEQFVKAGLLFLSKCDIVALPPNWELSRGTIEEVALAEELGLSFITEGTKS